MREKPSVSVGIGKSVKRLINHPWFVGIVGGIIAGIILYFLLEKFDALMEIYRIVRDYMTIPLIVIIVCAIIIGVALFILYGRKKSGAIIFSVVIIAVIISFFLVPVIREFFNAIAALATLIGVLITLFTILRSLQSEKKKIAFQDLPFRIFNISQIEEIKEELNWNPEFIKEYLPLNEIEELPLDKNILLKGKIGIGKTRNIFRIMEKAHVETVIVVTENVKTLGVQRFENLDFQDKAILIWDDVHRSSKEFLDALPYLRKKDNLLVIAAIRSVDYEKIEKDANIREGELFTEVDLGLFHKEKIKQFIELCEKEFKKFLTDDLRKALLEKACLGDSTPLYVVSIFLKEQQITENTIDNLPEDVVELWGGYFTDLTSNEKCFMKALKAAKLGYSPPYSELIENLYADAFFGEPRDLTDVINSLESEHWIVVTSHYYGCLDVQLECFEFGKVDMENFLRCILEKELVLEYHLQLLMGVSSHYYEEKEYCMVEKLMDKAIGLKPDDVEAYNNRGVAYFEKGELDAAIKDYDKAIGLKPDYAEAYNNRGVAYFEKGELDAAIKDYDKAIGLKPDYAEAYNNRGLAYSEKGELDAAIKDYDKAIGLKPDDAEAYNNRGNAYSKKGELDAAIKDYDKAIGLKSDFAEAYHNRGLAYSEKGELDAAIKDYDKAIGLKSDDAKAYYNRGVAYFEKGELDAAIKDYDKAIGLKPDDAKAYNNRGAAYSEKGELDAAIKDYDKAIGLKSDYAKAYYNRGLAYSKKGELDAAIKDYDKCAILLLKRGTISNAAFHFVQIFNLISRTENLKILCTECGLIAVFLMDKFKEGIDSSNILSKFGFEDLTSLLKDVYQYENLLRNTYSIVLLYRLHKAYIDENVKVSEFLSEKEISFLNEKLLKDMKESWEEIDEERTKIILAALFS